MKIPPCLLALRPPLMPCQVTALIVALALYLGASNAHAISYPANNSTNFPSGSYNDGSATVLNYRYFVPVNYDANDAATLHPLVLFLHGNGEKGTDNNKQLGNNANGGMIFISNGSPDNQSAFPCFWVAPQCSVSDWEYDYVPAQLEGMIDELIANYNIDPDRIYITGLSMGGGGVTSQLAAYPNRYAAANPNAGWYNGNASAYAHVPLWAFHCANDGAVSVNGSDVLASEMRKYGGTPIYTRYNTGGHSGSWGRAYTNTPLVEWMMSQRRGQEPTSLAGPYVKVTSPTDTGHTSTSASTLSINGVADHDTTTVWYRNSQFYSNGATTASGTSNWNVTVNPIRHSSPGKPNEIYVEAETVAFGDPGNGLTTTNDFLLINGVSSTGDSIQPEIAITSPTNNGTHSTSNALVSLSGTASDNVAVTSITWSSSNGTSGNITPETTWQLNDVALQTGANVITITASDATNNVRTNSITVILTSAGGGDSAQPVVVITSPTSNATHTTPASLVSLAGTASDNVGITSMTWSSSNGASGNIIPGATWQINDVSLQTGDNIITITAQDAANNIGTDTITVTLAATNEPPVVNAGNDDTSPILAGGTIDVTLAGSASDDGFPQGSSLATQWSVFSGPDVVTFTDDSDPTTTATFTSAGTYVLRLTANDSSLTSYDDVTITIQPEIIASAASIRFDFGSSSFPTAGNWNNVTSSWVGQWITDAIDTDGILTGVSLSIDTRFQSNNSNGVISDETYIPSAARDSFYVANAGVATVTLGGLDIGRTYAIRLFGSRAGAGNRVTLYTIGSESLLLDAVDNTTQVAEFTSLIPEVDGSITLQVATDDGVGYGYLGVIELTPEEEIVETWYSEDIGPIYAVGSTETTTTGFTLEGGGGMGTGQLYDMFQYVYLPYSGDVTVTTRVDSIVGAHFKATGMIMMRPSTVDNVRFAATGLRKNHALIHTYRQTDAAVGGEVLQGGLVPPYWIRLERIGDSFTSYHSADGISWTQLGSPTTIVMPDEILIGLGALSAEWHYLATVEFSNLVIE